MNFLFLFADEMSASALGCYGNPVVQTPEFDRIASEGTRFENCFVQNPVCSPSRCSLMTGTYVHNRGHRTLWNLLKPDEPSLLRYLKQGGYEVKWFGKNDLYSQAYLDEVCDDIDLKRAGEEPLPSRPFKGYESRIPVCKPGEPGDKTFLMEPGEPEGEERPMEPDIGRALDYLEGRTEGDPPFFLYLPISMPHPPYSVCREFYEKYRPEEVASLLDDPVEGKPSYEEWIRKYREVEGLPRETFEKIYAVYLGSVSYIDWMMGELDRMLEKKGLKDDTMVIISSDHGDWHGTRRLVEKWPNAMDDELIRVPLIIRMPGGKNGHVVREQVELFDIMATVLEAAGIQARHTHFARSLVEQLNGSGGDRNRAVFCEGGYDTREPHCFEGYPGRQLPGGKGGKMAAVAKSLYGAKRDMQQQHPETVCRTVMIRTLHYKLVRRTSGENELYDLKKDPKEYENLYHDSRYREQKMELEHRLLDWYLATSDTVPLEEDPRFFK